MPEPEPVPEPTENNDRTVRNLHRAGRGSLVGQDKKRKQNIFLDIEPEPYKMPFEDLAPNDPDVEQMRQIVSVKNERPEFRTELSKTIFGKALEKKLKTLIF